MFALAVRGLAARKLRGALTAFAILLGVAMVAGTFMLKGSVDKAFDDIFSAANEGIDVIVEPKLAFEGGFELPEARVSVPAGLLAEIEAVDGVARAAGDIGDDTSIAILDGSGERIGPPSGGPPQIANSVLPEPFNPFTWIEGGEPTTADEVAIDSITAEAEDYAVGEQITISGREGSKQYTLSGIGRFGTGVPLGGASLAVFTLDEVQRITGNEGQFTAIDVEADPGVSPEQLRDRINQLLSKRYDATTGTEQAADQAGEIKDGFSFLTIALLVFAGISVFVGAFLIFNTFSITVAQRTGEFGMLRTLGASSRQVLATVIGEALILGLIASFLGIAARARLRPAGHRRLQGDRLRAAPVGHRRAACGDHRPAAGRHPRHPGLGDHAGAARHPGQPAGGDERHAARRSGDPCAPHLDRAGTAAARARRARRGPLRQRLVRLGTAAARPRPAAALRRRGDARRHADQAACGLRRGADRAPARRHRPSRPREHAAQPEPHRDDFGRADDRRRAGRLRLGLRLLGEQVGRRRARSDLRRRSDDHQHGRLLTLLAAGRRGRRRGRGRRDGLPGGGLGGAGCAPRRRRQRGRHRARSRDPAAGRRARLGAGLRSDAAGARTRSGDRRVAVGRRQRGRGRRRAADDHG